MGYREPFYLFPRTMKSGKQIWYYQVSLPDGKRSTAKSTGKVKKTEAKAFCKNLELTGRLMPTKSSIFRDYFANWFVWGPDPENPLCSYLRSQRDRTYSRAYIDISRQVIEKHILPYFGAMKLDSITVRHIEKWADSLVEAKLAPKTVRNVMGLLKTMFKEAVRLGDLIVNPIINVKLPGMKQVRASKKRRGILSKNEIEKLFPDVGWEIVWNNHIIGCTASLLAWKTAARMGEVRAIQRKHIDLNLGTISILQSLDVVTGKIKSTKTGAILERFPIKDQLLIKLLTQLVEYTSDPESFIFSHNGGISPLGHNAIRDQLYNAMERIEITPEQRKTRNIGFHSWRHAFTTYWRHEGVPDFLIKRVTRHSTEEMTDNYSQAEIDDMYARFGATS